MKKKNTKLYYYAVVDQSVFITSSLKCVNKAETVFNCLWRYI